MSSLALPMKRSRRSANCCWRVSPPPKRATWCDGRKSVTVILEGSIAALLERIVAAFRRSRVPYVLIGAWALTAWGRPRATNDVDFLVLVDEGDLPRLGEKLV